jgi:hypothetical protein
MPSQIYLRITQVYYMLRSPIKLVMLSALTLSVVVSAMPTAALAQRFIPRSNGLPGRREGGGARGCDAKVMLPETTSTDIRAKKAMMSLVPAEQGATTVSAYPTFFWYVAATTAPLEFMLMDEQGQELYKTEFKTNGEAGIISLSLPQTANLPPLEVDKSYRWSFTLLCDQQDQSANIVMNGWVQRVQPSAELSRQLSAATAPEKSAIYAANGIWHEAIATLADLRYLQPNDAALQAKWDELLASVQLDYWASQPLAAMQPFEPQPVSDAAAPQVPVSRITPGVGDR